MTTNTKLNDEKMNLVLKGNCTEISDILQFIEEVPLEFSTLDNPYTLHVTWENIRNREGNIKIRHVLINLSEDSHLITYLGVSIPKEYQGPWKYQESNYDPIPYTSFSNGVDTLVVHHKRAN